MSSSSQAWRALPDRLIGGADKEDFLGADQDTCKVFY